MSWPPPSQPNPAQPPSYAQGETQQQRTARRSRNVVIVIVLCALAAGGVIWLRTPTRSTPTAPTSQRADVGFVLEGCDRSGSELQWVRVRGVVDGPPNDIVWFRAAVLADGATVGTAVTSVDIGPTGRAKFDVLVRLEEERLPRVECQLELR
jgi:hypothetical protein